MIQETYIQDISNRSVDELVNAMGMTGIAKSQVSSAPLEGSAMKSDPVAPSAISSSPV